MKIFIKYEKNYNINCNIWSWSKMGHGAIEKQQKKYKNTKIATPDYECSLTHKLHLCQMHLCA